MLNAGQKYCRMLQGEHSVILSTFIKLPFVINIFVFSIFECLLKTDFSVFLVISQGRYLIPGSFSFAHLTHWMLTLCLLVLSAANLYNLDPDEAGYLQIYGQEFSFTVMHEWILQTRFPTI